MNGTLEKSGGMSISATLDCEVPRPKNCGECSRFSRDKDNPGHGWCDNWAGVDLMESCLCHPNFGRLLDKKASPKTGDKQ